MILSAKVLPGLLLVGVLTPTSSLSAAPTIEPGLWSYSASTLITGTRNGEQCVKPDQIDAFLTGPHNRHYHCTYPSRTVGGGVVAFAGDCLDKGDRNRYHVEAHGRYRPEEFELEGSVKGTFFGISISVPIKIKAHRLAAECRTPN